MRASTNHQDAERAKDTINNFSIAHQFRIAHYYTENISGSEANRAELNRLIHHAESGDCIVIESVDRLTRLNNKDWQTLKNAIGQKGIRIISIDLPTSYMNIQNPDEFSQSFLSALNNLMLDMMAAIARKDYVQRRERTLQGIQKAKSGGKYLGRRPNIELHKKIITLKEKGLGATDIAKILKCSRKTVYNVIKTID